MTYSQLSVVSELEAVDSSLDVKLSISVSSSLSVSSSKSTLIVFDFFINLQWKLTVVCALSVYFDCYCDIVHI